MKIASGKDMDFYKCKILRPLLAALLFHAQEVVFHARIPCKTDTRMTYIGVVF